MMNMNSLKYIAVLGLTLVLIGCQTSPEPVTTPNISPDKPSGIPTPEGVKITPYEQPNIQRKSIPVQPPAPKPTVQQRFKDGRNLPAFQALMKQTQNAYAKMQWNEAESYALQAQRIAPQAAETFLYLAMIANQKHQSVNAEALANRGLSYAQSNAMKKQLWAVILKAATLQKNSTKILQAQNAIKALS